MAVLVNTSDNTKGGGHWYTKDGRSMHVVPKANGDGTRRTTLRDARKHDLLPSVTGILGVMDKPAIKEWAMKKAAHAAVDNPISHGEEVWQWEKRVVNAAWQARDEAADLGSRIHHCLEHPGEPVPEELACYVVPALDIVARSGINVLAREEALVNVDQGYAGTADLVFERDGAVGIGDYKSRKTMPGRAVPGYEGDAMQIVAYIIAKFGEAPLTDGKAFGVNIIISTTEPGRVEPIRHNPDTLWSAWEAFKCCAGLWRYLKNYDPRSR
jgi:hypothetical protein